jgi:protocatechuate 3,4-dioxygenase beta subunit
MISVKGLRVLFPFGWRFGDSPPQHRELIMGGGFWPEFDFKKRSHRIAGEGFDMTERTTRSALTRRVAVAGLLAAPSLALPNAAVRAGDSVATPDGSAATPGEPVATPGEPVATPGRVAAPRVAFSCIATPQAVAGPYYFDPKLSRLDVTEGHPGVPLRIRLVVIDTASCQPLTGARIDIWHARADGFYSGYRGQGDNHKIDTTGGTFMRGTQETDGQGEARFHTVYPGWYIGRTPHIHFKVFTDEKNVLTAQMYFPDALSQYLYGNVDAYKRKRPRDTFNVNDSLALMDNSHGGFCDIREQADHYLATLILGVDRSATAWADDAWPPPGMTSESMARHAGAVAIVPGVPQSLQKVFD